MGDEADLVVAFNEQVLYGRIEQGAYRAGTVILLENRWATDPGEDVHGQYAEALATFAERGFRVVELPIAAAAHAVAPEVEVGMNMFVLGMLCQVYDCDLALAQEEVRAVFGWKGVVVVEVNQRLIAAGYAFARERVDLAFDILPRLRIGS